MSQSFTWIIFSKREYLNPVPFKNDVKWPCFHHVGAESTNAVLTLMADEWRGDVIALVGDATGLEFYEHKNCPASMHRLLELTEGEGPWRYAALWFSDVSGRFKCAKGKVGRQRVGEGVMIGVSAHTVQEALDAVAHGADYLGVGAVFATHTKTDVSEMPRQTLLDICNAVDVPVVAIGGIHKENILQLKGTGVDGVALVSAIFAAKNIEAECRELRALSEQIVK